MGEEKKEAQWIDFGVLPAILVKNKQEFLNQIEQVKDSVTEIHIDVMDNKFVPNWTVKPEEIGEFPYSNKLKYTFHWMVKKPENWIDELRGNYLHLIQIESVESQSHWEKIKKTIKESGGRIGIVINPKTELSKIIPYIPEVERVLVMFVEPGYSHQKYILEVEEKVRELRRRYPKLNIEVDGGINLETIGRASKAGANAFAACSAIFSSGNIPEAIKKLRESAISVHKR